MFSPTSTHNISTDATAPAYNTYTRNATITFVDAVGRDYHIAQANALAGTDLSAYFLTDIDGQTITTWSAGADAQAGTASSGFTVAAAAQLSTTADASPSLGVVASATGQLSGAADANATCGTVLPSMSETMASCDASPSLGTNLPATAEGSASADISATCGTVASMVATGTASGDITPPELEPEEMPYIPPWRMAKVPFSGSRVAAVPATSRVSAVPAASRVSAVPAASRVAAVPFASRVSPARIE